MARPRCLTTRPPNGLMDVTGTTTGQSRIEHLTFDSCRRRRLARSRWRKQADIGTPRRPDPDKAVSRRDRRVEPRSGRGRKAEKKQPSRRFQLGQYWRCDPLLDPGFPDTKQRRPKPSTKPMREASERPHFPRPKQPAVRTGAEVQASLFHGRRQAAVSARPRRIRTARA